jgi:hypothetical protein
MIWVVIAISIVIAVAHCPLTGVKVYVVLPVVVVLIVDGLHVPLTPLFDVTGNVGAVLF